MNILNFLTIQIRNFFNQINIDVITIIFINFQDKNHLLTKLKGDFL